MGKREGEREEKDKGENQGEKGDKKEEEEEGGSQTRRKRRRTR